MITNKDLETLADGILFLLRDKPGNHFSLKKLSEKFKVEISDIVSAFTLLNDLGYKFDKNKKLEMKFESAPDNLTATEITYKLRTKFFGQVCYSYNIVKSTNDIALNLADHGEKEGTIVTAEEQTKGRGRMGRKWHSPYGSGIYVSVILKPNFPPENAPGISLVAALALADTISEIIPDKVKIKWPNDVLLSGKKTAGILAELSAEKNKVNHLVVGVGINVNQISADFPDDIKQTATSIRRILRKKIERVELLKSFLLKFENEYRDYQKNLLKKSKKRIVKYSSLIGNEVTILSGKESLAGKAVDISYRGELIIKKNGHTIAVSSGEVTVSK